MWIRHRLQQGDGGGGGGGGGQGGGGGTPWFGDAHKQLVETKGWKTADDVITSYSNLEKLTGRPADQIVAKPKDENDAEGIKSWRSAIGVPEKDDGYEFPEELKDDPLVPAIRAAAHKHGIPSAALKAAMPEILQAAAAANQKALTEREALDKQGITKLQTEWGASFDSKKELARRAALAFTKGMDPESVQLFSEAAAGDPRFMRGFAAFGELIAEHPFEGGTGGGGGGNISIAQAREKLSSLQKERSEGKLTDKQYWERRKPLDDVLASAPASAP